MKDKIMYLILGILIGAVITAFCFVVYSRTAGSGKNQMPSMPSGDFKQMTDENGNTINMDRMQKGDRSQDTTSDTQTQDTASNQVNN